MLTPTVIWAVGTTPLPCFRCTLEQHSATPHMSGWKEVWGLHTPILCLPYGAGGQEEELVIPAAAGWASLLLQDCLVYLFSLQSEEDHLLALGVDCLSGGAGAWEYKVCMGECQCIYCIHFCLSTNRPRVQFCLLNWAPWVCWLHVLGGRALASHTRRLHGETL